MKLVVIYGPPAVGKLTVAKELSRITGYKIFHNHLALDMLESVLERSSSKYWELLDKYRLELIDAAAKDNAKGLIITSVHINGPDDKFIRDLIKIMEENNGSSHFVHLSCDMVELKGRLADPSRKRHGKLTDAAVLEKFMSEKDVVSQIGFVSSLRIENTNMPAEEVAIRIKEHYGL